MYGVFPAKSDDCQVYNLFSGLHKLILNSVISPQGISNDSKQQVVEINKFILHIPECMEFELFEVRARKTNKA